MNRILAVALLVASVSANAALFDRGGGLFYDDVLNITWLQDANYAATSGFDDNGRMTWDEAISWADGATYFDEVRGVTWDNWRLATTDVNGDYVSPICGSEFECRDNELGYMFYYNGVTADNPGPFINVIGVIDLLGYFYWSAAETNPPPVSTANVFQYSNGAQGFSEKAGDGYSWLVMDGDVGVVPVPGAVWLFASALGLLGWVRRSS